MANPVGAIRYAIRQFRLSPVFTASAVLTLSLGIGGTTAIFTLIHAVMLRSLPVADPERLYRVGDGDNCCVQGGPQDRWGLFSYPLFERLKAEAPEFEHLTAFQAGGFRVSVRRPGVDVAARSLRTEYVTGNYFTTFGIGAFGGRVFTADDDTPASPPVVVISHHSWEAIYGGDHSLVGQTLVIEGHPFTVAGLAGELAVRRRPPAAQADDRDRPSRRRCRRDERAVRQQPAAVDGRVRTRAADRLRERGEPAARALGRATDADGSTDGHRRVAIADRHAGARRKHPARHRRRQCGPRPRDWVRSAAALDLFLCLPISFPHTHL